MQGFEALRLAEKTMRSWALMGPRSEDGFLLLYELLTGTLRIELGVQLTDDITPALEPEPAAMPSEQEVDARSLHERPETLPCARCGIAVALEAPCCHRCTAVSTLLTRSKTVSCWHSVLHTAYSPLPTQRRVQFPLALAKHEVMEETMLAARVVYRTWLLGSCMFGDRSKLMIARRVVPSDLLPAKLQYAIMSTISQAHSEGGDIRLPRFPFTDPRQLQQLQVRGPSRYGYRHTHTRTHTPARTLHCRTFYRRTGAF